MDNHEKLLERQQRILDTMNGKKTDRTPLMFSGDSGMMRYVNPNVTYEEMILNHEKLTQQLITDFFPKFPKVDWVQAVGMSSRNMGAGQMAKTLLPGVDLPKDQMWQLDFPNIMVEEDYDFILKNGWRKFNEIVMFDRLGYSPESLGEDGEEGARNKSLLTQAGFPFQRGTMFPETFDLLAFGRGLMDFFVDLYEYEDKIKEILEIMLCEFEEDFEPVIIQTVNEAKANGEIAVFAVQPGVNANCNMVSREVFEKFAWPSYKRQADLVLKHGGYVFFHMDSNWTDFLDYFTDFPKGRCMYDSDGFTDLEKIRDTLGGRMAFTGNIPPAIMSFGTPDENYKIVKDQIEKMGDSFVAAPSCSLAPNMPRENLEAFYAAIDEL
jgi:hypothetical protein